VAPAQEATSASVPEKPVEYRLNDEARSVSARRLLETLMNDPWIRMDPDQRSRFLRAVVHAQRAFDAEMDRAFEVDDALGARGATNTERHEAVTAIEIAAAERIGARLAEELATFLAPEQMRQLQGRISFRDFMLGFFRSDAIGEVR
jgi:hypothetical protein